jgi:hypothetical protein
MDPGIHIDDHDVNIVEILGQDLKRFMAAAGMTQSTPGFDRRVRDHVV